MRTICLENECLETALFVMERGLANVTQLRNANAWRTEHRPQLGKLAMTQGKLTMAQVFAVLGEQAMNGGLFGQTAVKLGFLEYGEIYDLLQDQVRLTPTLLDALIATGALTPEQALHTSEQSHQTVAPDLDLPTLEPLHS